MGMECGRCEVDYRSPMIGSCADPDCPLKHPRTAAEERNVAYVRIAALQAEREADKSCIEADSIQISYLNARLENAEARIAALQAENARLKEALEAAVKVQEMAAMSGGFHARSAENAERQRDSAEAQLAALTARVAELEAALRFYADPKIYKPHPHGPAFDRRDLSWHARAVLSAKIEGARHDD